MKQEARHITVEETEKLCQLYMDCQLSVMEETELEYVLMKSKLDSPLINETRVLMGISRSVNFQAKKKRLLVTWGWRAAACVAIIIGCAALIKNNVTRKTDTFAYKECTEISVDNSKCIKIEKVEATKKEPQESKSSSLSMKHSKRKTRKVRKKPSDMTSAQEEHAIIAETTTPLTEPTIPSTHIVPEKVVYIINGERQVPDLDMPSINDLRMRGQRLTTEVMRQIQESIDF